MFEALCFKKPAELYDFTNPNWLPTINFGHLKLGTQQPVDSNRYERAQRRSEVQQIKDNVIQLTAQVILQEITESAVREEVLKLLEEIEEEVALIEECLTDIIEQLILDSVKCHLEHIVKEEMEAEMLRCSEGRCKCIHEIDGLRKELANCLPFNN